MAESTKDTIHVVRLKKRFVFCENGTRAWSTPQPFRRAQMMMVLEQLEFPAKKIVIGWAEKAREYSTKYPIWEWVGARVRKPLHRFVS